MELNKLTARLLAEGWTEDKTPPGCKPWNRFYGGWTYDWMSRQHVVFETPCGLLYKRNEVSHSGTMAWKGIEWSEENDCITVICPHYDRKGPCKLNHPLLEESAMAGCHYEHLYFCAVHETDKDYCYENSAKRVIDIADEEKKRLWQEFSDKRDGRVCIHHSRYNRNTKMWTIRYSPEQCIRYGCSYCSILGKEIDRTKKGNVFFDEKRSVSIEDAGFFESERVYVTKGIPLLPKTAPLDLCEAIVKFGKKDVKWRLRMNIHSELFFHPELKVEFLNFRAERKSGRDLLQDLQDVANGITVVHDVDQKKTQAAAKTKRRAENLQRKKKAAERKILNSGLESFNRYQRERLEKLLGVDRCYELDSDFRRKQAEQQLSMFD